MLDYFKKIIGSSLIKNVDIEKNNFGLGGFDKNWELFHGIKQDNKKEVCVFLFDKKNASPQLIEFLKKEPNTLQKFRHPQILQIVDPLVEDKKGMGFVTEKFQCTLQQKMENNKEICESMLELKLHLLSLFQVLNFLHYTSKSAHFNISPENIYIMPDGSWKLGGMYFTSQILDNEIGVNNYDLNNKCIPNLNYTAPEVQSKGKGMLQSDIFSIGMLLLQVTKHIHDKGQYDPFFTIRDSESYKQQIQGMGKRLQNEQFFTGAEDGLKDVLKKLLQYKSEGRPQISELLHIQWFNDVYVKSIRHLETIIDIEKQQQPNFLKGLGQILFKFPENILKKRVFPKLLDLFQYPHLIISVLQICINSLEKLDKVQYKQIIWPKLQKLTQSKEIPGQALYILVENIEKLFEYVGKQEIQNSIIPLLLKCYDFPVAKLQELSLAKTEFIMKHWEYQSFTKPKIIPKIFNMLGNEKTTLPIKKQNLCLVKQILKTLDKQSINDILLPALDKVKKSQTDLEIRMSMLQIYQIIAKQLDANILANKLLPSLIPMLLDPNLKKNEYEQYSKTIHGFLNRIDEERLKELPVETENFDFNQIANQTKINIQKQEQEKQSNQQTNNNNNNASNFDFLDTLNTINSNTATKANNQNQNTINNIQNNNNNNINNDDDFFSDIQNQPTTIQNKKTNNTVKSSNNNDDDFFNDFDNQQQNQAQPQKNNNQNITKKPAVVDPFFENINNQQNLNTFQQSQKIIPPPQKPKQNTGFSVQPPPTNIQKTPIIQQNQQQNKDPFFDTFSNSNQGQQQSTNQWQNSNKQVIDDDPFADIQPQQNQQPVQNNQMSFPINNNVVNPISTNNYDDPFAEIENDNPPKIQQSLSQNQIQTQNKGNLFSKMQIKKPGQKKQWNMNSGLGEGQDDNLNQNQQSNNNNTKQNTSNDIDDLF